ncbi:MAG: hypothetical protein E6G66_03800 [Actinobacteria bacterium]|nr:MAG: hypothetical protein E6G66_03800 [Actinomycetota bacterium]
MTLVTLAMGTGVSPSLAPREPIPGMAIAACPAGGHGSEGRSLGSALWPAGQAPTEGEGSPGGAG